MAIRACLEEGKAGLALPPRAQEGLWIAGPQPQTDLQLNSVPVNTDLQAGRFLPGKQDSQAPLSIMLTRFSSPQMANWHFVVILCDQATLTPAFHPGLVQVPKGEWAPH